MILNCDNCCNKFNHTKDSFSYLNQNLSLIGLCDNCYLQIDSKLLIQVDVSKIELIKKKARKLMLQRNLRV